MRQIGIIAESLHDSNALRNLLESHSAGYRFIPILKRYHGDQVTSDKFIKLLGGVNTTKYRIIICSKDLDGLEGEKEKERYCKNWFKKINEVLDTEAILLLHRYEFEALLLADIETFNEFYGCQIKFKGDPTRKSEPKEFLKSKSQKCRAIYEESDCPAIFQQIDIKMVHHSNAYLRQKMKYIG